MRLSPLAAIAAACVLTLTACGDDGDDPESSDNGDSPSASPTSDEPAKDKGKGGKGDKGDDGDPGSVVCSALDAKDVGDAIGATLKKGDLAGGCRFADPNNPLGASVGLTQTPAAGAGGIQGAEQTVGVLVKGKPEPVDVGDDAFVIVGKGLVGNTVSGAAVLVDDELIQISVTPSGEVAKDQLKVQTVDLLELVAEAV